MISIASDHGGYRLKEHIKAYLTAKGLSAVSYTHLLAQAGHEVKVILPLYEGVSGEWRSQMTFLKYFNVTLSWRQVYCGIFQLERDGVTYWFVDNEYYFCLLYTSRCV